MKATFSYHHSLANDEKNGADVFSVFPRFLDTSGLVRHPHLLKNGKYPMQHAVSLMIPLYALCITDRTRFQAPVWWGHSQQILGKMAHQFQSKSYQGKSWTGAHHRTLGINAQCWISCWSWEWYDWNCNSCWLYRYSYCANLRYMWHSTNLMFFCRLGKWHVYLAATTSATIICTRMEEARKDVHITVIHSCGSLYQIHQSMLNFFLNYTFHHLKILHSLRWSDLLSGVCY